MLIVDRRYVSHYDRRYVTRDTTCRFHPDAISMM